MRPGIYLVCDPHTHGAQEAVARMLYAAGVRPAMEIQAGAGRAWAAAVIPPPANEPGIGADIHTDGTDILIWSGEIFLPQEWQRTQPGGHHDLSQISRALLQRLREEGIEPLGELDGSFCGAWYNRRRQRWTVFNDRLGLYPVFWSADTRRLVASPHARFTFLGSDEPLHYDERGATDLLRTGNMVDDHTLLEGVHWLKPAGAVFWGEEGCGSYPYWDLSRLVSRSAPLDKKGFALEAYQHALKETVERHSVSSVPLMLGISGGMDSRCYLAACDSLQRLPACFTAGFPFSEDVRYGRQAARAVQAVHQQIPLVVDEVISALEQAIIDTDGLHSAAHMTPVAAIRPYLASHAGAILLEGYYHGAQAGQYVPADEEVAWDDPPHSRSWARRFLHAGMEQDALQSMLHPDLARDSYRLWKTHVNDCYHRAPFDDRLQKCEYTVIGGRSGRIDVLGTALMRDHVHVRTPACEKAMLAWMVNTAPRLRRGKRLCLDFIRLHHPDLARVPRSNAGGMPIDDDRWLREKCWQHEKLIRLYSAIRHPRMRRWGMDGHALRAWTFYHWQQTGRLDVLREGDARILHWVRPQAVRDAWDRALHQPLDALPLLLLATIEIALRSLDDLRRPMPVPADQLVRFRRIEAGTQETADNIVISTHTV